MRPAVDVETHRLLAECRAAVAELHEALEALGDDAGRAAELVGVLHVLEARVHERFAAVQEQVLDR